MSVASGEAGQSGLSVFAIRRIFDGIIVGCIRALKGHVRCLEEIRLLSEGSRRDRRGATGGRGRRDDIDDAPDRSGAVQRRPASFDDLDAVDAAHRDLLEVDVVDLIARDGQPVD